MVQWESSAFATVGAGSITAYSNAMFFVGYDVVRRRPPSFWLGAWAWIFGVDPPESTPKTWDKPGRGQREEPLTVPYSVSGVVPSLSMAAVSLNGSSANITSTGCQKSRGRKRKSR